jgi:hypothetical protein
MAKIEKVQMLVTLKTRARKYIKGATVMAPLPEDVTDEIAAQTGTLEIFEAPKPKAKPKPPKKSKKAEPEVKDG